MLQAVTSRLLGRVSDLDGRIRDAGDLTRLLASRQAPSGGINAYLVPSGIAGLEARAATGLFVQEVRRGLAIVLMVQSTDAAGARAMSRIDEIVEEILAALLGWAPGDEVGVFQLRRTATVPTERGLLAYQIELQINDQLRITP